MNGLEFRGITFSTYHEVIVWELRAAIERYFEYWEKMIWNEQSELQSHLAPIEQHRLPIVVLSCTLLECAINFYLCTKCDAKLFAKLDKSESLYSKWTLVPKQFVPKYEISTPSELASDLKRLIDRRKVIIHSKPMISIEGGNQHVGNEPNIELNEHEFVGCCATLPWKLVNNLINCDVESMMFLSSLNMHCGSVASVFEGQDRKLKNRSAIPRELILEIMGQGHDRETATICALMLRADRTTNESGFFELWPRTGKRVVLKPLKFFTNQSRL